MNHAAIPINITNTQKTIFISDLPYMHDKFFSAFTVLAFVRHLQNSGLRKNLHSFLSTPRANCPFAAVWKYFHSRNTIKSILWRIHATPKFVLSYIHPIHCLTLATCFSLTIS